MIRTFVVVVRRKVDVHLSVQPSVPTGQACEVVVFSGKNILRREVRSGDMYASIDEVEEKLGRTMRKFKERKEARKGKVASVDAAAVFLDIPDEADDEMDDTFAASASSEISSLMPNVEGLVKRKTFPLPLQTVEEAILCLEYAQLHPVLLFYRLGRNHGSLSGGLTRAFVPLPFDCFQVYRPLFLFVQNAWYRQGFSCIPAQQWWLRFD